MKSRVLVTGANGFVGRELCAKLSSQGCLVRAAVRGESAGLQVGTQIVVGNVDGLTDWQNALKDTDLLFHLAARVHVMKDVSTDPLAEFRKVNLHGTENLARQAASAGVKRLVYVSSIKVNGEGTEESPYSESDAADPQDPYGISKWEAEQALHRISQETGLEVVIVRPPLVYGPGVKGNFISLFKAIDKGLPLPLAGARNARSLVYVGNLVDALITCATKAEAAGQTYLVSDGKAVSTAELVSEIARALGRKDRSFYFPPSILSAVAGLLGKTAQVDRLFGSLRVDSSKLGQQLAWTPPYTLQQGLAETARWYHQQR
ncbi:MAG: SDR family oxidoreductase [Gallionella sp.]|nr:SDR family oxidoreductase [Gallionella sp.]